MTSRLESTSRIPPHDLDAERAILGAILVSPEESLPLIIDALTPEHFFTEAHRLLYAQALLLHDDGAGISVETMQDALTEAGELAAIGGPAMLALAVEAGAMVIPALLPKYVEIVKRHAARRNAIQACTSAIGALFGPSGEEPSRPVRDVAAELSDILSHLADEADPERQERADEPLGVVAARLLVDMATSLPDFVKYPIGKLNGLMGGGSKRGELVYLGAGFGVGKTAVMLEWATHAAREQGKRVLIISAEMTKEAIAGRILTQQGMIAASAFRSGDLSPEEWDKAHATAARVADYPITIDDQACTLGGIRRLVRRHSPDLLVIDYLQLLQGPRGGSGQDERSEKRHEIDALSRGLKRIAKRHRCVVMVLSQLTLIPDGKGRFQRPTGASLKESRGPSQDADTIFLLWRPDPEKTAVELIVAKGRNHASGSVDLEFTSTYLWFREV